MTVASFDIVFYTAIFILPGFIINSIIDTTNPPKKHNDGIFFLKCMGYSIVSCAIWSWLYKIVIMCKCISTIMHWILLITISIIGSFLIGLVFAIIKQKQVLERILWEFGVNTIHSTPTAWDYIFSKQEECFVVITLLNDNQIYGWYSSNSFTSSEPDERDIYVEILYQYREGQWIKDEQAKGVYIAKNQIKHIEFKKGVDNNEK